MPRYKIIIEYCGTNIAGWQRQANAISIQQIIEEAVFKFSQEIVTVHGSGRTDAGVHALGQVAHFDLIKEYPPYIVKRALNHFIRTYLVVILECDFALDNFHARFSATKRHYQYIILNRPSPSMIELNRVWHYRHPLDVSLMQEGAKLLLGQHDFSSFRALSCQAKSPIKTLDKLDVFLENEKIFLEISARSFLHHMVRNIVGTLVLVGNGKWNIKDLENALLAKSRSKAGPTAPSYGLYLTKVDY